jgi:hypothetical protein
MMTDTAHTANCWNSRLMGAAPRHARPFIAVFLGLVVVCALTPLNLWPFSNWELFSRLRGPVESRWEAVVEHNGLAVADTTGPRRACGPLLRSATARFGPATSVRIYHVELLLSNRSGSHAAPPSRILVVTCAAKGASAPG